MVYDFCWLSGAGPSSSAAKNFVIAGSEKERSVESRQAKLAPEATPPVGTERSENSAAT